MHGQGPQPCHRGSRAAAGHVSEGDITHGALSARVPYVSAAARRRALQHDPRFASALFYLVLPTDRAVASQVEAHGNDIFAESDFGGGITEGQPFLQVDVFANHCSLPGAAIGNPQALLRRRKVRGSIRYILSGADYRPVKTIPIGIIGENVACSSVISDDCIAGLNIFGQVGGGEVPTRLGL